MGVGNDILEVTTPTVPPLADKSQETASFPFPLVSKEICQEIASLLSTGVSMEQSKHVSKEFSLTFEEENFTLRPPKLDGWMSRRAREKNTLKTVNSRVYNQNST